MGTLPVSCSTGGALLMGTSVLELHPLPLHRQIQQFADSVIRAGYSQLAVIPLFLLPGVHVLEDIPSQVRMAQEALGTTLTLSVRSYLGRHPQVSRLLAASPLRPTQARILIAHGSRRPGGNQAVAAIATQIQAIPAYWASTPNLTTQVLQLMGQGYREIQIQPYFLFPGGITDAIAQMVATLAQEHPTVQFQVMPPIGASEALADRVIDLMTEPIP